MRCSTALPTTSGSGTPFPHLRVFQHLVHHLPTTAGICSSRGSAPLVKYLNGLTTLSTSAHLTSQGYHSSRNVKIVHQKSPFIPVIGRYARTTRFQAEKACQCCSSLFVEHFSQDNYALPGRVAMPGRPRASSSRSRHVQRERRRGHRPG